MPCYHVGNLHICRPSGETKPAPGRRRKRWWCFNCRKHLMHTRMMFDPGPESYYGPNFWWECPQCHGEHVLFPGREWVYED
jgi:hypothetical protein